MINRWTRGKTVIPDVLVFGGGYPKFRWLPKITNWNNISIFWLGTELVWIRNKIKDC